MEVLPASLFYCGQCADVNSTPEEEHLEGWKQESAVDGEGRNLCFLCGCAVQSGRNYMKANQVIMRDGEVHYSLTWLDLERCNTQTVC